MVRAATIFVLAAILSGIGPVQAQDDTGPVKIRVRRILFKAGNQYSVSVPDLEFHVLLQKQFDMINSSITADYDFTRKDMGFGMSHAFNFFLVNPGISVDDNLYFREVFSDSTGIWSRKQSISPFLIHEFDDRSTVALNFIFEREWSPKRREGSDIVHDYDYSLRLVYFFHEQLSTDDNTTVTISAERSYRLFRGEYNYFILNLDSQITRKLNEHVTYRNRASYDGNVTPQQSPLFFIGGQNSLVGFERDEFWGRRVISMQNLLEVKPFPFYELKIKGLNFRELSILTQIDIGQVRGARKVAELREQDMNLKLGIGLGFGFTTDLSYMPDTPLYFTVASPSTNVADFKFYAGFGGWLR